ncbi:MAG: OmpA family protein [Sulfurovum sp.]|nr:OmpA family protein [Sulfurovum sp.]
MKKIWPWLLALLLLIIFCVWSKKDSIQVTSTAPTQVATTPIASPVKHYLDYTITQKATDYTLNGRFANTKQHTLLSDTYVDNSSHLTVSNTSIDATLQGEEGITLTNKILPHFIKNYTNGKIVYHDNTLRVYGDVSNYEAQRQMQNLLSSSTLASQDNTNVIVEKSVHFIITKILDKVDFTGTFNSQLQGKTLRNKLPASTSTQISQSMHLVDKGSIAFTENFLPSFMEKYKNGKIEYKDDILNISGMVGTEKDLVEMKKLLSESTLTIVNNTTVDQEALAQAAAEEAELKALEEAQQSKMATEAEEKRLAEEKAKRDEEKRLSEVQVAAEALKEKITKLLKIENIEFRVAKGSLTTKGAITVDKLATILSEHPNIKAEIAGHTDSDGSAIFNQKLSQRRVDTVRSRLIKKGINASRLTAVGYGESKPLVPNTNKTNKQKNRRVEINIQGE